MIRELEANLIHKLDVFGVFDVKINSQVNFYANSLNAGCSVPAHAWYSLFSFHRLG